MAYGESREPGGTHEVQMVAESGRHPRFLSLSSSFASIIRCTSVQKNYKSAPGMSHHCLNVFDRRVWGIEIVNKYSYTCRGRNMNNCTHRDGTKTSLVEGFLREANEGFRYTSLLLPPF